MSLQMLFLEYNFSLILMRINSQKITFPFKNVLFWWLKSKKYFLVFVFSCIVVIHMFLYLWNGLWGLTKVLHYEFQNFPLSGASVTRSHFLLALSAGAVRIRRLNLCRGVRPSNGATCWPRVATRKVSGRDPGGWAVHDPGLIVVM